MSQEAIVNPSEKTTPESYPAELKDLLTRAHKGDSTVLPALQKAFDQNPELTGKFGDLVHHAENALMQLAANTSLLGKEAIRRQMLDLKARLKATASTELEYLLIDRIVVCWLGVNYYEIDCASHLCEPGSAATKDAAQKRLDRAHQRFLTATKSLAVVQKLLHRSPSTYDLLKKTVEAA